jgi:hypothetical protein
MDPTMTSQVISEIRNTVLNSINDAELQRALDKWVKDNHSDVKIAERDYHLLKSVITEYLDSFILFGYTPSGERIANAVFAGSPLTNFATNAFSDSLSYEVRRIQTNF